MTLSAYYQGRLVWTADPWPDIELEPISKGWTYGVSDLKGWTYGVSETPQEEP